MEVKTKQRRVLRTAITNGNKELEGLLGAARVDLDSVRISWELLSGKFEDLQKVDGEIYELMLNTEATTEETLLAEISRCDEYRVIVSRARIRCDQVLAAGHERADSHISVDDQLSVANGAGRRKFKLPKIEFKKYDGNIKDWLPFWAQFKKVHEDRDIDESDKIEYLIQATVEGSRARQLVESYPAMSGNYTKIIESMQSRFGREDLQIEVYVRELLKLILSNALNSRNMDLSALYDKIETQLRALDTLGITSDKCAAMLFPLIESCLPEELLRVWQRASASLIVTTVATGTASQSTLETRLQSLMEFLKSEVENEQRVSLAAEGFGLNSLQAAEESNKKKKPIVKSGTVTPTAASLVNCNVSKCVFCGGTHDCEACFKAHKMTMEQKKTALSEKRACFKCLKVGHMSRKCRARIKCVICGQSHVVLMCSDLSTTQRRSEENKGNKPDVVTTEQSLSNQTSTLVFMQTLRVRLQIGDGIYTARALIDTGSQRSYILETTAARLGYGSKRKEKLVHCLFGGTMTTQTHNCYDITLKQGDFSYTFEVLDEKKICNEIPSVFRGPWIEELKALNVTLSDTQDSSPIEILIGADMAGRLYNGKRHVLRSGLVAVGTFLGWTLMGVVPLSTPRVNTTLSCLVREASITELWQLDALGIKDPAESKSHKEVALAAKEFFEQTICVDQDGRYEVRLPWVEGHPPLPTNYNLAQKRLDATMNKLKGRELHNSYDLVFKEWVEEGVIEEIDEVELSDKTHYLPHRPVIKENSTTKIRPVFDASAHEKDRPSLNLCLEKGVNLIELIPTILLRFREHEIGVVSDIRKAFLQIGISEPDRNFLRFIWVDPEGVFKTYRHKRVVFGVSSSPFLLGATIEHHLAECLKKCEKSNTIYSCDTVKRLAKSFYVDNCVTSVPNSDTAHSFIEESTTIMAEAKFDLRGWELTRNDGDESTIIPVLGLSWRPGHDTLEISGEWLKDIPKSLETATTKRLILSMAQRVFDPIGFTCPTTLIPKLLLQRLWEEKLAWDDTVGDEVDRVFRNWMKELPSLTTIKIPRCICSDLGMTHQWSLHTFCDASQRAYSAVVFARVIHEGRVIVRLLAARARVAPLKKMTIPRLELLAATIAVRLCASVRDNLQEDVKCRFWTDSTTVLSWINRKEEWATFVGNRVTEIRKLSSIDDWSHVPGAVNPADLPSRGCSPKQLIESKWWEGPSWLYQEQGCWPRERWSCDEDEVLKERKKRVIATLFSDCNVIPVDWHLTYFSKYLRIVRMMAWVFRFVNKVRSRGMPILAGNLSTEELDRAEQFILKTVQCESFSGTLDKKLCALKLFCDESGLLRLKTRISNRPDDHNFCFPVVLPAKHYVVERLIFDEHVRSCHVGAQGLLGILRGKYWILGGRRTVKSVISKCVVCKRQNSKPFVVEVPPLPMDRVRDAAAFEVVGVDFAGPLYLKDGRKSWVCLFTCAVYRAVHLELTTSLSTHHFMQAFRRFVSRRGRPSVIYSDNGTNFVGTANAFDRLNWEEIAESVSVERIKWRFNPPTAAWWGGFWERLIGVLKQLLRRVLGRAALNYEELQTLLCDCEAIINARPLTYISDDSDDLMALTPSMFLRDQFHSGVPECDAVDSTSLSRRLRYNQKLRYDLRRRFRNEYLGQLRSITEKSCTREIALGEIVLIGSDNSKRIDWPLGKVVELIPGRDKRTRLVRVETTRGQLFRPVQRLYPLECLDERQAEEAPAPDVKEEDSESAGVSGVSSDVQSRVPVVKVTRKGRLVRLPKRYLDC